MKRCTELCIHVCICYCIISIFKRVPSLHLTVRTARRPGRGDTGPLGHSRRVCNTTRPWRRTAWYSLQSETETCCAKRQARTRHGPHGTEDECATHTGTHVCTAFLALAVTHSAPEATWARAGQRCRDPPGSRGASHRAGSREPVQVGEGDPHVRGEHRREPLEHRRRAPPASEGGTHRHPSL